MHVVRKHLFIINTSTSIKHCRITIIILTTLLPNIPWPPHTTKNGHSFRSQPDMGIIYRGYITDSGGQTFGAWKTLLHSPCWSASSSGSNHGFHKTSTACKNNLLLDDKINDIQIIFVCGSFLVQNNSQYYSLGLNWNENLFVKHAF